MEAQKLFTEKYRSKSFGDLVLDEASKNTIKKLLDENSIPNFIFTSHSPGTGKTSCSRIIVGYLGCDVLSLNASDERGIDTIREKVGNFCRHMSLKKGVKKCVFLDEADFLTSQAQASLRNLMEEVSDNVFFILTSNYITKLIEPIRSRCFVVDFNHPPEDKVYERIEEICNKEGVTIDIGTLIKAYYPDIRKMVLSVQLFKNNVDMKTLFKDEDYGKFINVIAKGNFQDAKEMYNDLSIDTMDFLRWVLNNLDTLKVKTASLGKLCEVLCEMEKSMVLGIPGKLVMFAYLEKLKTCLIM